MEIETGGDAENDPCERTSSKKTEIYITPEEMNEICTVHSEMAKNFAFADWTHCPVVSSELMRENLAISYRDRYSVLAALLDKYTIAYHQSFDSILLPGMLVMANEARKMNFTSNQMSDFYHSANVEQVSLFHPLLVRIRSHAEELLKQWEDHPTLKGVSGDCY